MTDPAIRTVREDDDVHVIEGYGPAFGGPFNGRDSYRTFASARTDFHLGLFPDDAESPRYTRPLNYQHGFDAEVGLRRVGGWTPIRSDERGLWIQAQLDKHDAYYGALRELLGKDALAFSPESAEHAIRIDERTGEWLDWPAIAMALTPTPSNPWSAIAARTADTLRIVAQEEAPGTPGTPAGTVPDTLPGTPAVRGGSYDAATAAGILQSLLYLRGCEVGEADQCAMLDTAAAAVQEFITAEMAEPEPDMDGPEAMAYMSAVRAGARNSSGDQAHIDAIHQHATALGATAHQGDEAPGGDDSGDSEADAARSGGTVPAVLRIVEPADPDAERKRLADFAEAVARDAVRSFTGA